MAKSYATSWVLGGTTRQPEVLTLPASVLNEAEGEISVWAYEDGVDRRVSILDTTATAGRMRFVKSAGRVMELYINNAWWFGISALTIGYHLLKLVWKGNYVALFVDGVPRKELNSTTAVSFAGVTTVYVGGSLYTAQWNAPIDNLVIRNKTQATPEAIAAQAALEYTQGQVLADGNTTYCQDFDGSLAAVCPFTKKITANVGNYIIENPDGTKGAHVLVRSRYPSDGIKPAAVYTDYTDLKTKIGYTENPKITVINGDSVGTLYPQVDIGGSEKLTITPASRQVWKDDSLISPTSVKLSGDGWSAFRPGMTSVSVDSDGSSLITVQRKLLLDSDSNIKLPPVVGTKTVTSTPAAMFSGASALPNRLSMIVYNNGTESCYWGPPGVTVSTGFPLLPGDSIEFEFDAKWATVIMFVASEDIEVKVAELA